MSISSGVVATDAESQAAAYAAFVAAYPAFENTHVMDDLRATQYTALDEGGHVYLDYTGGGLYAASQVREHMELVLGNVFGNPHSMNPTSQPITERIEHARRYILEFFRASPDEYEVIFTPNASGALKLVAESYPFEDTSQLVQTWDNHNSVNGIREFARAKGAKRTLVPIVYPELRVDEAALFEALDQPAGAGRRLFAFPAQSNFSGCQHPLEWIEAAHERGWDVIVDCAAFAPTNRLDLSRWKPDFVPLSFYKMFGYPTGMGALIIRKDKIDMLRRPWFAGGTVIVVSVQADWHYFLENGERFEDGTLSYLQIPAVEIGLRHLNDVGIDLIHERVMCFTGYILDELLAMRHSNGQPMVELYGPRTTDMRGGTIAMNLLQPSGEMVDERIVETRAIANHMSLRIGCFCNPGVAEAALHIRKDRLEASAPGNVQIEGPISFDDVSDGLGLDNAGSIRVSVGIATNFADVHTFVEFIRSFRDEVHSKEGLAPRAHC